MASIMVLDQATVNQIAAGEVIERPSSAVKECVENALDAGAKAVTVELRDGGLSLIRITDNGTGIQPDDVRAAFLPHATSKIRTAEDLMNISSLGFRGEALASIAAVSQAELITRTKDSLMGIRFRIEGGEEKEYSEVGAPEGTTFLIRNLFYNTPARRKFLKTAATEGAYVSTLMERLALSRPDVSFRLITGNQTKLHTSGNGRLKDVIYTIYGREISSCLVPLSREGDPIRISGFAGKPEINRGNRSYENYFINGRTVKSILITKAIENAYRGYVMQQKYPFIVFRMDIPSELLDVNVHPTKMELRFSNEEEVYQAVFTCIRDALAGKELIPRHAFSEKPVRSPENIAPDRGPEPFERNRRIEEKQEGGPVFSAVKSDPAGRPSDPGYISGSREKEPSGFVREQSSWEPSTIERVQKNQMLEVLEELQQRFSEKQAAAEAEGSWAEEVPGEGIRLSGAKPSDTDDGAAAPGLSPGESAPDAGQAVPDDKNSMKQMELFEDRLLTAETRSRYRFIGQLFDTYWLIQYRDQLLIMDQHAAHEKVLYERNVKAFREKEMLSQEIQPPVILTLNAREAQVIAEREDLFHRFGFRIEPFGGREYAVYAVPANLPGLAEETLLKELIDSLADESGHAETSVIEDRLALMSCKAAVKGNNRLSSAEAEHLLDEMLKLDNPYLCPHGRPTIITFSRTELERKFKRIVN